MKRLYAVLFLLFLAACSEELRPQEVWIRNSQGESIYLQISGYEHNASKKLAIIQHGLASNMEHPAVQVAKKAFLDRGYVVITFDSRYSLGKSSGEVINVRLSTFENDLQTVLNWVRKQEFYHEPFSLAGHSLGGASVIRYAADNSSLIDSVIAITPVVSGKKWEESCMANMPDFCKKWKEKGIYDYQAEIIPYAVVEDAKTYDAFQEAANIKAKVLLIATEDDNIIAPQDIKTFYRHLGIPKTLGEVSEGGHNFTTEQSRRELYDVIEKFLSEPC